MNLLEQLATFMFPPGAPEEDVLTHSGQLEEKAASGDASIPFYPHSRYILRNQAPEQTLTEENLTHIAEARRLAESTGVLTPELGAHLLPIAMVEGWGGMMGVRGSQGFYASQSFLSKIKRMGLDLDENFISSYVKGDKMLEPTFRADLPANGPKVAAVILSEKADRDKTRTVEGAIKRYNGKGSAIEDWNGGTSASTEVYWGKVQEAAKMLQHPSNVAFRRYFERVYGAPR